MELRGKDEYFQNLTQSSKSFTKLLSLHRDPSFCANFKFCATIPMVFDNRHEFTFRYLYILETVKNGIDAGLYNVLRFLLHFLFSETLRDLCHGINCMT